MTQIFAEDGKVIPVTVIEAGPCPVVQVKTPETDGYTALKLGFLPAKEKELNKPDAGQFKKAGIAPCKVLREVRVESAEGYSVGTQITADVFAAGDHVDVSGVTKGHGYTGVIKRWNQHRLKESHGVGPGSMGANSSPSRVFKHKNLAGQYGVENVTIQNLEVVRVDAARNAILVRGAVPGVKGSIVMLKTSVKA